MPTVFIVALLAFLLGLALCFVGYRFVLVMLPILGFFAGLWIGAYLVMLLLGGGFLGTVIGLVVGVLLGIIFAVLSYLFYQVGVALIAGAFGAALGSGIMTAIGFDPGLVTAIVAIITALVVAGLTLLLNLDKYLIIAITAIGGANLILLSGLLLFGQVTPADLQAGGNLIKPILDASVFWLLIWLALAVAGIVVQIRTNQDYVFTKDRYAEWWG